MTLPDGQQTQVPLMPLMMDGHRPGVRLNPPGLGEHTHELLKELGYDDEAIKALVAGPTGT